MAKNIKPHQISRDQIVELEQVCARVVSVAYDNGFTPGSSENDGGTRPNFVSWNWNFVSSSLNLNCADIDTGAIGTPGSPTPQLQAWADAINAVAPANYFAAFGFKPAPTWRYTKLTTCDPNVQFGTFTMVRDNEATYKVYPVCKLETKVTCWRYFTKDKSGVKTVNYCKPDPDNPGEYLSAEAPTWVPVEGQPAVAIPEDCLVACDYPFSDCVKGVPEVACTSKILDGTFCDKVYGSEPEDEDQTVQEDIFIEFIQCEDGTTFTEYFIIVDGGPVPYEPQGEIVDCETCLPPVIVPECPPDAVPECVEIPAPWAVLWDNSNYNDGSAAPFPHLKNGEAYTFEVEQADGTKTPVTFTADPYFNNFKLVMEAAFPDCKVSFGCANHTAPAGCNPGMAATMAAYVARGIPFPTQAEFWASGWIVECSGCESPFVRVEIISANNTAWEGTAKVLVPHVLDGGVPQTFFRFKSCGTSYWEDCNENGIPEPVGAKCATPKAPEVQDARLVCDWCCEFPKVGSDRNGINNPIHGPFTLGSNSYPKLADLIAALEAEGGSFETECETAECHSRTVTICGAEKYETLSYVSGFDQSVVSYTASKCSKRGCDGETLEEIVDCLTPACDVLVATDCIGFAEGIQLGTEADGLFVPFGQPIIRQLVSERVWNKATKTCEVLPGEPSTVYLNFDDPTQDITDWVEAAIAANQVTVTPCDSTAFKSELCDPQGNRYTIVTVEVNTPLGTAIATTVYNQNGVSIAQPANLQPCPGNFTPIKGCIRNASGHIIKNSVSEWLGTDENGNPLYGGIRENNSALTLYTLQAGERFDCDCKSKCPDVVGGKKYTYDISGFEFPCPDSTIVIDGEVVDLCDGGPTNYVNCGPLADGGIRSYDSSTFPDVFGRRCVFEAGSNPDGYPLANVNCDPLNAADQILNTGGYLGNSSGSTSAWQNIWLNLDTVGLDGQSGASIGGSLKFAADACDGGSGQAIALFDTATGQHLNYLPAYAAGASTNDADCKAFNTGQWAGQASNNFCVEYDVSGVADLGTLWFYSIVLGPGDGLKNIRINGQPLSPNSCNVTDATALATILSQTSGDEWFINDDGELCVESNSHVYGTLTCGEASADPDIVDNSRNIMADFVALKPSQFDTLCAKLDLIAELLSKPEEEETCKACIEFEGFDFEGGGFWNSGAFLAIVNGTPTTTPWNGAATGTNKSAFYQDMVDAVNALPGWTMSVSQDVPTTNGSDRVKWRLEYEGPKDGSNVLTIERRSGDTLIVDVTGDNAANFSFADGNGAIGTREHEGCDGTTVTDTSGQKRVSAERVQQIEQAFEKSRNVEVEKRA